MIRSPLKINYLKISTINCYTFKYRQLNMGCQACQTSDVQDHMNLKSELIKLKVACDLYKGRKDVELKKQEQLLSFQLIKPVKNRSQTLERTIIQGNVRFSNQKLIYFYIANEATKILDHSLSLQTQTQVDRLQPHFNLILYCSTFFGFEDLNKFTERFRKRFPYYQFPNDNDIDNELLKAEKRSEVLWKSQLQYVMQYSMNYGLSMETINAVGHGYTYGSQEYLKSV